MASSFTIQNTVDFCGPFLNYYPLSIGGSNQPALGIANSIAQVVLAPPFKWRFNRNSVNFITTSGTQTYMSANGWVGVTAYTVGTTIIDSNGNGQKCVVSGTSGGSAPTWSTNLFATTSDGSGNLSWQNIGPLSAIPQMTDFGFIEKASVQDINNGSVWKELSIALDLSRDSTTSCPKLISAQSDDNLGDIALRLMPPPGAAYPVTVQYQKQLATYTSLGQTWSPLPDYLYMTYNFGFLALAFLYKGDSRFEWASQQFTTRLLSYAEGLKESEISAFLQNWQSSSTAFALWAQKVQQGVAGRGLGG
jgi:hypothetical protein